MKIIGYFSIYKYWKWCKENKHPRGGWAEECDCLPVLENKKIAGTNYGSSCDDTWEVKNKPRRKSWKERNE